MDWDWDPQVMEQIFIHVDDTVNNNNNKLFMFLKIYTLVHVLKNQMGSDF
jgi:hypothetical protein